MHSKLRARLNTVFWRRFKALVSSLIGVVSLVLDVGERRESPGAQTIQLILEEHDLLFLQLDHVNQLALVSNSHDALPGVGGRIIACGRLEVNDLLALVDFETQVTSLALELRVLTPLVLDLLHELLLLRGIRLQSILRVLIELLDLTLEALLVLFVLLLILALDNLLSLFRHSIELNVESALLVVLNLESQTLDLIFDLFELGVIFEDELHIVHFLVAFVLDAIILCVDDVNVD